ncbi:MAG: cobyric acid synthase [Actinomycetales bacterium]
MSGLLVAGTSSDAGKSLLVTGLCRALRRRGLSVAPFKAQNMSNNSMVCRDGTEIGRAQYLQAQAAGVTASCLHNPVLLKPGSDRRSHIVLRGRPAGTLDAGQYATGRRELAGAAFAAYAELAASVDLVVCEGAGSPAEINLRNGDYVNLGLAERFDLPVLVVGDIDRGGVLASLYGTWALLAPHDRDRLKAFAINKFRGDVEVLIPGLAEITRRTGVPFVGVLPWLEGVWLDGEDTLEVGRWRASGQTTDAADHSVATDCEDQGRLSVAVVRFPRTSNATDVDALAAEPGVQVRVTKSPQVCADADLLVLPGSRATVSDLAWLHEHGLAEVVRERARQARPVLGICGGYQMLTERLDDPVESGRTGVPGLGLLAGHVRFATEKILARPTGTWHGIPVDGYEIHHGVVTDPVTGADSDFPGGATREAVYGSMWHGTLECDAFRRRFLAEVAARTGSTWQPDPTAESFAAHRERAIDTLADAVEAHLDVPGLLGLAYRGTCGDAEVRHAATPQHTATPDNTGPDDAEARHTAMPHTATPDNTTPDDAQARHAATPRDTATPDNGAPDTATPDDTTPDDTVTPDDASSGDRATHHRPIPAPTPTTTSRPRPMGGS